jgi:hypothetical protein
VSHRGLSPLRRPSVGTGRRRRNRYGALGEGDLADLTPCAAAD